MITEIGGGLMNTGEIDLMLQVIYNLVKLTQIGGFVGYQSGVTLYHSRLSSNY